MSSPLPKVFVIVGPTAAGKSAAGLGLAKAVGGEVICADARTIYRGMDIGTAKPVGERAWGEGKLGGEKPLMVEGVAHWGVDLIEPSERYSAAQFQAYADERIVDIVERGKIPVLVGGTGLYVRAVIDRPTFADVAPNADWREEFGKRSLDDLCAELDSLDPMARGLLDVQNRRRVERALEILRATGRPLSESRSNEPAKYDPTFLGVDPGKEVLNERIDERVNGMIAAGLIDEVRGLLDRYGTNASGLQTIGYQEFFPFFAGQMALKEAILSLKANTKDYAKRQRTWWRKDERIAWFASPENLLEHLHR